MAGPSSDLVEVKVEPEQEDQEEEEEEEDNENESVKSEASSTPSYAQNWTPQDPGSESAQARRSSSIESTISDKMRDRKPPPVIIPDKEILSQAITDVPPRYVRDVLRNICDRFPAARDMALKELTIFEDYLLQESHLEPGHPDDEEDEKTQSNFELGEEECNWRWGEALINKPWWKQRCAKYDTCYRCAEEFEVEDNAVDDCRWHSGVKVVDEDAEIWQSGEFDKFNLTLFDSFKDHPNYAPGFKWDCCDEEVDDVSSGCETGRHLRTRKTPSIPKTNPED